MCWIVVRPRLYRAHTLRSRANTATIVHYRQALIGSLPPCAMPNLAIAPGDERKPMAEIEQRLLMLIDDEPAQCRLITALAAREGWRTVIARDAETAIAMLGTRQGMQLAAIMLDQWVPGDDACTLIAELKSAPPGPADPDADHFGLAAARGRGNARRGDRLSDQAGRARPADAGAARRDHPRGPARRTSAADREDRQ